MNIHEYQAKALLRSYGAPVSDGRIVLRAEEAKLLGYRNYADVSRKRKRWPSRCSAARW